VPSAASARKPAANKKGLLETKKTTHFLAKNRSIPLFFAPIPEDQFHPNQPLQPSRPPKRIFPLHENPKIVQNLLLNELFLIPYYLFT
jgi:hypothetical protein